MPPDYSAHGWQVDRIIYITHWLMLVLFVFWSAYFLYVLYRYSAKRNPKADYHGMRSHWSTWSEAGVAVVEVVLLVGFSIPGWYQWSKRVEQETNPLEVRIVAEQFAWNVHYPGPDGKFGRTLVSLVTSTNPVGLDVTDPAAKDDVVALNNLHLEVNRQALIHVMSKDVIHSFKLPVMRVEQDAIPGMDVPIHFTPIRTTDGKSRARNCAALGTTECADRFSSTPKPICRSSWRSNRKWSR
jgi:cytochrome c oxidase subunit 2